MYEFTRWGPPKPLGVEIVDLTYWFMFPISIAIAMIANGAGVGGATFFSPLFVLALQLEPKVAIGTALITEVFGFASGVTAHARARAIDWKLAQTLAAVAVPAAVLGSLIGGAVPPTVLKAILGLGLVVIGVAFVTHRDQSGEDDAIANGVGVVAPFTSRQLTTRDGQVYDYRICRRGEGRLFSTVGGLLVGLISTGLGEANSYALVKRCRVPTRVSVATGVVVVAITALAASITHLIDFVQSGGDTLDTVARLAVFTVPGVIIGGQLGPRVTRRLPEMVLIHTLGWLFLAIATITLLEAFLT